MPCHSRWLCITLSLAFIAPIFAQNEQRVEQRQHPSSRPVVEEVDPVSGTAKKIGTFWFDPRLLFTTYFDDNIFATSDGEIQDYVFVISPSVQLHSDWEKHSLNIELGADAARYVDNSRQDHEHYRFISEGRYDFTADFNVFGGLRYYRDTEDRESPDDVFGRDPTTYEDIGAYAGAFKQFGRSAIRLGGTWQQLNFDDAISELAPNIILGRINNDDRDRDLFTGGVHLSHLLAPGRIVFVQIGGDFRRYVDKVDDFGFERDSDGYRVIAGVNLAWAGLVEAELFGGYLHQNYEDANFDTVKEPTFGLVIDYFVSEFTTLSAYADRTLSETTAFGSSSFLNSIVGLQANHEFTRKLNGGVRLGYTRSEFQDIDRDEDFAFLGLTGRAIVSKRFYLQSDYQFRNLDSNIADLDFARHQIYLRIGANF